MQLFISAGEASGDLHAAQVIRELRQIDPNVRISFLGGDLMAREAGHEPLIHYRDMAFMGFTEVIKHLPQIFSNLRTAKGAIATTRPDAIILVDYPGFNMKLATYGRALGIPVFYYIAPKVWAWKAHRIKALKRDVKRIFSILPFEPEWFDRHQLAVEYVGNPSVEEVNAAIRALPSRVEFLNTHNLSHDKPILAIIPGSRKGEISCNLPIMDAVAKRHPEMTSVIAGAPGIDLSLYKRYSTLPIIDASTLELMAHSRAALVTSGTASLECALAGTPQVVCYRSIGWKPAHDLFTHILKIPYVSLPNLITGPIDEDARKKQNKKGIVRGYIVPEMLVHHCNPDEVDKELTPLIGDTEARMKQLNGYARMRELLSSRMSAAQTVATRINSLVKTGY